MQVPVGDESPSGKVTTGSGSPEAAWPVPRLASPDIASKLLHRHPAVAMIRPGASQAQRSGFAPAFGLLQRSPVTLGLTQIKGEAPPRPEPASDVTRSAFHHRATLPSALWARGGQESFSTALAADRLSAATFGVAWTSPHDVRPAAQGPILQQVGGASESRTGHFVHVPGERYSIFSFSEAGGALRRAAPGRVTMINRLPPTLPTAAWTPGPAGQGEARLSFQHVASDQRPAHTVQRQASGAADAVTAAVENTPALPAVSSPPAATDLAQVADQVYQLIVRRLSHERDRRGL
jgi:hypothetical protein